MAKVKITTGENSFSLNGVQMNKGDVKVYFREDGISIGGILCQLSEVEVDGVVSDSDTALRTLLDTKVFKKGGGTGGNGGTVVESVTGDLVSGTAKNPTVNLPSDVIKEGNTSMMPLGGKIPVYSEQGLLSTGTPLFPENAVPLYYFNMMLGREGVLHLPENASESFTLSDVGVLDINVDGEGAKLTFTSVIDGIKYLKLNIFNGFEISTKFFNGVLNEGEVDTELPTQGISINGGYAELIYHTSMHHARVFKLTISNNGQDATWSDRSL